jgi:hypothetical protein
MVMGVFFSQQRALKVIVTDLVLVIIVPFTSMYLFEIHVVLV